MTQVASPIVVASPLLRLGAFVVDILILTVITLPLALVFGDQDPGKVDPTFFAFAMIIAASYHIFFLCTMSATLGKLALHLYVSDRQGQRIRPDTAILRYLVYMVGQLIFIGMVVSAVLVLVDPRRRAIHDRVAGTLVVVGRPPGVEL
jgi:uncharacterized RDD family membrane protein YckC